MKPEDMSQDDMFGLANAIMLSQTKNLIGDDDVVGTLTLRCQCGATQKVTPDQRIFDVPGALFPEDKGIVWYCETCAEVVKKMNEMVK